MKNLGNYFLILFITFNLMAQTNFIIGLDVSSLKQVEVNGGIFKENGIQKSFFDIIKYKNIDFVRLKLWHTPDGGYNGLNNVVDQAKKIKAFGFKFLLDIHYSDTWADPAHQTKPQNWKNLSYDTLIDSVFAYTFNVINTLKTYKCLPDIVQVGNEITSGFLWDDGRVDGRYDNDIQWSKFTLLLKKAIKAVNDAKSINDSIKIMLHIDKGGDNATSTWFFDKIKSYGVNFDIIGLSYYPWWHGKMADLRNNIISLYQKFKKPIIVVETAYPFTLSWNDNTTNIVGNANQLLDGYPASIDGQKKYLEDLIVMLKNIDNKCFGLFYWEPAWISTISWGSSWENLCLFDFNGELLPSIYGFEKKVDVIGGSVNKTSSNDIKVYPNPFNNSSKIKIHLVKNSYVKIILCDILGRKIEILNDEICPSGTNLFEVYATNLTSGIYILKVIINNEVKPIKIMLVK